MAWKDLVARLEGELKKSNETIATLQRQLAESEKKDAAALRSGHGRPHTGQVQQITNLQREVQAIRAERDKLAKDNASLDETLQNTVAKLQKVEPEGHAEIRKLKEEIKNLQYQCHGKDETLKRVQAQRSSDQSRSARESGQRFQLVNTKNDLARANAEIERLNASNGSLTRQLDVEKKENTKRINFMKCDPRKLYDEDDEEPLPVDSAVRRALNAQTFSPPSPVKTFKTPFIPDHLKAKKTEKAAAPKKRKRSQQEELDEEMEDLKIEGFVAPTEPRRKKRASVPGSFGNPMSIVDSEDEEFPDPAVFLKKGKAVSETSLKTAPRHGLGKATRLDNNDDDDGLPRQATFTAKPEQKQNKQPSKATSLPTPTSPTFSLPDSSAFTFKAICSYHANGTPHYIYHSADLTNTMTELQDRITLTTNVWESRAGEDWRFAYEQRTRHNKTASCVTRQLQQRRTRWHLGEEGRYACKDCAQSGRPCFTYVALKQDAGYEYGEFRLLPLWEGDRQRAVAKGKEVRYWVDELVELGDGDEMSEDGGVGVSDSEIGAWGWETTEEVGWIRSEIGL